jgi:hypothetical protein
VQQGPDVGGELPVAVAAALADPALRGCATVGEHVPICRHRRRAMTRRFRCVVGSLRNVRFWSGGMGKVYLAVDTLRRESRSSSCAAMTPSVRRFAEARAGP